MPRGYNLGPCKGVNRDNSRLVLLNEFGGSVLGVGMGE